VGEEEKKFSKLSVRKLPFERLVSYSVYNRVFQMKNEIILERFLLEMKRIFA
jgi:hypothetical protein